MTIVPSCCDKRYAAIDELVNDMHNQDALAQGSSTAAVYASPEDLGAELLCKFWDILKVNPQLNLENAVQEHLNVCVPDDQGCYMAVCSCGKHTQMDDTHTSTCEVQEMLMEVCTDKLSSLGGRTITGMRCEISQSASISCCGTKPSKKTNTALCPQHSQQKPTPHYCGVGKAPKKTPNEDTSRANEPLTEALQGIKMAQDHDSNCAWRLSELMEAEDRICQHMRRLEAKELLGIAQLQQADSMWTSMEGAYLNKIRESQQKQEKMFAQEKEIRMNLSKWRKKEKARVKELKDLQVNTSKTEEKTRLKQKQIEKLTRDCEFFTKQIEAAEQEILQLQCTNSKKMNPSQKAQETIEAEIAELENRISEEKRKRDSHEKEGRGTVRGARDHLSTACRVLLQAQMERDDLIAEEEALNTEIEAVNETMESCKNKCQLKMKSLRDEIVAVEKDIENNNFKCVRCNICVSTTDFKKRCMECPRCLKGTCKYMDKACSSDVSGCMCPDVKERLVENVLENMYNNLESEMKKNGSHLASDVLQCLKKSVTGKLDAPTREKIHAYVMKTVGKSLDASIMGAGVKTRCEMDPKQFAHLQLCLKEVVVGPVLEQRIFRIKENSDANIKSREKKKSQKEIILNMAQLTPCKRWSASDAPCNCSGGPESCACWKRAPPAAAEAQHHSGAGTSGVQGQSSVPRAHSCAAGRGEVDALRLVRGDGGRQQTFPSPPLPARRGARRWLPGLFSSHGLKGASRASVRSARSVRSATQSVCACSGTPRGPCRCGGGRSRSRNSMKSRSSHSSNAKYTACVRDKLIKDVTDVCTKVTASRSSANAGYCPYCRGPCACLEERELNSHRPSSRGSRTSGPPGARDLDALRSHPDVAIVPCPVERKSSSGVCDLGDKKSDFFKRFSAAESRRASQKELSGKKSEGGVASASSCLSWICGNKKDSGSSEPLKAGARDSQAASRLDGEDALGGGGSRSGSAGGTALAEEGKSEADGKGGAGAGTDGGKLSGTGSALAARAALGAGGTDGAGGTGAGAGGARGAVGLRGADEKDGRGGADPKDGRGGADGKDGRGAADGKEGRGGADPKDGRGGADGKDGQREADGKEGRVGADSKDGRGGSGGKDGRDSAAGKDGRDSATGKDGLGSKRGKLADSSSKSEFSDESDLLGGKIVDLGKSGAGAGGSCSKLGFTCKSSPYKQKAALVDSVIYCDSQLCTGPCASWRGSPSLHPVKKYHAKVKEVFELPRLTHTKDSSLNTENMENLVKDPCFKSFQRRIMAQSASGVRKTKKNHRNCACGKNDSPTDENVHRRVSKPSAGAMEPQLPAFLRQHQLKF